MRRSSVDLSISLVLGGSDRRQKSRQSLAALREFLLFGLLRSNASLRLPAGIGC
jgi:hypothetical protein